MDSTRLQHLLDLHQAGNDSAREALIEHSVERFRLLTRRMFRRDSDLRKLDETDDVLNKALLRLYRALAEVKPADVRAYVGLAARQIRWVILDLVREADRAKAINYIPGPAPKDKEPAARVGEPSTVLEWADFHKKVDSLPVEERETIDLLFYQGLTQPDAAGLLGVSLRTMKRRWQRARLMLRDVLGDGR
jgi:RNA polymerase sigma-70 factor (ECF subfamily)